ncbi:LysE family translocator [Allomeiothermus silvanus]|uniref:LysE family translocator n=1 Tax=Allomeiothermus silvanus TaxID=52022 RepID=UPI0023F174EA|nr:LysE family translocator [Allomeiothermus silvanus]
MLISSEKLSLFVLASVGILLIPGPNVIYIVTRSIAQGRAAGIASVLGINLATLTYTVAAALGLAAILLASAPAFNVVKWAGAAYLVYMGIRAFLSKGALEAIQPRKDGLFRVFAEGYVVNLLNPKMAFFIFAFLPQFVDPSYGQVVLQILALGGLFALLAIFSDGSYALLASSLGRWLQRNPHYFKRQRYVTGSIYIVLGVTSAFTGSHHK